jgi:hypothetical protein
MIRRLAGPAHWLILHLAVSSLPPPRARVSRAGWRNVASSRQAPRACGHRGHSHQVAYGNGPWSLHPNSNSQVGHVIYRHECSPGTLSRAWSGRSLAPVYPICGSLYEPRAPAVPRIATQVGSIYFDPSVGTRGRAVTRREREGLACHRPAGVASRFSAMTDGLPQHHRGTWGYGCD